MTQAAAKPRPIPKLITLDTIKPREIEWLWYPYFPSSAASLIFGPGGMGKSHITVDLAARITTGTPFPGETHRRKPAKVLMLTAEDEYDAVLVPRLIKAGADLSKIAVVEQSGAAGVILDERGMDQLKGYIRKFAAVVVFIDPVVAYTGSKVDMNKANEVRPFAGGLHQLAIDTKTAIIMVGHSRKGQEGDDPERMLGSVDFINAVRSVLFVSKGSSGGRIMKHVKSNYARLGFALAFDFDDNGVEWGSALTEDEEDNFTFERGPNASERAKLFLTSLLENGPVPSKDVEDGVKTAGLSMATVNRVKPGFARSYVSRRDGKVAWYWELLTPPKRVKDQTSAKETPSDLLSVESGRLTAFEDPLRGHGSLMDPGPGERFEVFDEYVATDRRERRRDPRSLAAEFLKELNHAS